MFQRYINWAAIAVLLGFVVIQDRSLYAQQVINPESVGGKLNRDSFTLCREIRTKFRGIRGQRTLFHKAYQIHEMADTIQRMIVLNAPVQGMDQALDDLRMLVDDLDQSLQSGRLPVLRDPVIEPTGPNGYVFYGGNGYPQPCFQYQGFPYRMVPEQSLSRLNQTLKEMKGSIGLLQARYAPLSRIGPERRLFPKPRPGLPSEVGREQPSTPLRQPEELQSENDSRWKPSRKEPSVFPPAIPPNRSVPSQQGPEFLPPSPSAG
ncbi:hypothetical protein [Gimesia fumaroli]|jgi:hypothetical protein|uniref:Uncharacterized protein n=1 Tax=Gimesia fumaroli TaxID=2527976 RepID=A0A518IE71_9PLAN|nr:hypothetical protein [Gimesia fumaroli]QDV51394.1 hypothetical protein Enr17x_34500 [Gimesia fumaroli]